MKVLAIETPNNKDSTNGIIRLKNSIDKHKCELDFYKLTATTPETLQEYLDLFNNIKYTYPLQGEKRIDEATNLRLTGYRASDVNKVFSATISHARAWSLCANNNEEIMVCEHDAIFTRQFKPFDWEGGVLGINDPRGATRRAAIFHDEIRLKGEGIHDVPWIDVSEVPQGLAGNSAYIIKPHFAKQLLEKLKEYGAWPNDALMCKQIFPQQLKICSPYYTTLQGIRSQTTL
jgi:GR25 family glycosyltransferase involved in LPS biosynthesis